MTKNENRINKLFEELVPTSGKADSLAGELVRATARIGYRFFNDGDMVNQGYGKETCNPAARFLIAKGNAEISSLTVALWEIFSEDAYEKVLDTLEGAVADYIKKEADKQVAITNAEAEAQKTSIAADAQAEANRKIAESLSDTLIEYQKIQKWDGKLPTVSGSNALVSIDPAE